MLQRCWRPLFEIVSLWERIKGSGQSLGCNPQQRGTRLGERQRGKISHFWLSPASQHCSMLSSGHMVWDTCVSEQKQARFAPCLEVLAGGPAKPLCHGACLFLPPSSYHVPAPAQLQGHRLLLPLQVHMWPRGGAKPGSWCSGSKKI